MRVAGDDCLGHMGWEGGRSDGLGHIAWKGERSGGVSHLGWEGGGGVFVLVT